jgi:hypothetical protein
MVSPLAEWRQKRLLAAAARGTPDALAAIDERTRSKRYNRLGQRRVPARPARRRDWRSACSTSAISCTSRTSTSVRRCGPAARRILFVPDVAVTAPARPIPQSAPAATTRAYRDSHRAFYAKHHPRWAPLLDAYLRLKGA